MRIQNGIKHFLFWAILGFLMESILYFCFDNDYGSGILMGPWTMIYGFGSLLLLFVHQYVKKKLPYFFICAFLLTILEWLGGTILERTFHIVYWSYQFLPLAIGDYISVETFFLWGILSLLFLKVTKPLERFFAFVPNYIVFGILFYFLLDCFFTFFR